MIELPDGIYPNGATPALIDFGGVLRPVLGGPLQRVNRMGSRYRVGLTFPVFHNQREGRLVVARLVRAKREGLRVPFPLGEARQPVSGAPVVDGAGQAGMALAVRGLQPRASILEGYWLSVERSDGQHYLYNTGAVMADAAGKALIPVEPMLRHPHADGDSVHIVVPMIEGIIDGDEQAWSVSVDSFVSIQVVIEEAA